MVSNNLCRDCDHSIVCEKRKLIDKFSDDVKTPLGVDITMDLCKDFKEVDIN